MSNGSLVKKVALGIATTAIVVWGFKKIYNGYRDKQLKVIQVDTAILDNIKDEHLLNSLFKMSCDTFAASKSSSKNDQALYERQCSTLYSLYKQIKEGDADEFTTNKERLTPEKYNVWHQQAGKSELTCKKEYILIVGMLDDNFNTTIVKVADGTIKEISYQSSVPGAASAAAHMDGAAGFNKGVSVVAKEDDTEYISALNQDEAKMYQTYEKIKQSKDEALLVSLVETGKLKTDSKDKEGMTPLMVAVDCEFSAKSVQKLIDLGCDVNQQNSDGMTPLHMSAVVENQDSFKVLVENGGDLEMKDNEGETVKQVAEQSKNQMIINCMEQTLGYSMTMTQFERKNQ